MQIQSLKYWYLCKGTDSVGVEETLAKSGEKSIIGAENYNGLASEIIKNPEGFTLTLDGKAVTKGYAYSPYKGRELVIDTTDINGKTIQKYIEENIDLFAEDGNHIGGWFNSEDGKFYLDVSRVDTDLQKAVRNASDNNQLAIYDITNGTEIRETEYSAILRKETLGTQTKQPEAIQEGVGKNSTSIETTDGEKGINIIEEIKTRYSKGDKDDELNYLYDNIENRYEVASFLQRKPENFSEKEALSYYMYTSQDYKEINAALRTENINTNWKGVVKYMDSALEKLPEVNGGTVYRGIESKRIIKDLKNKSVGDIYSDKGFISTSFDEHIAKNFQGDDGIILKIISETGRDVSKVSWAPEEMEVLFKPNTKFEIIDKYDNYIILQEL